MKTQERRNSKRGFTLLELLVVIAIIGVLSSVVLVSLNSARDKGRYAQVVSQMKEIQKAAQLYYNEQGEHASDVGPSQTPPFVPELLSTWPDPPCGFEYDWNNWIVWNSYDVVRIDLYRSNISQPALYLCVYDGNDNDTSSCNGGGIEITTIDSISCR